VLRFSREARKTEHRKKESTAVPEPDEGLPKAKDADRVGSVIYG